MSAIRISQVSSGMRQREVWYSSKRSNRQSILDVFVSSSCHYNPKRVKAFCATVFSISVNYVHFVVTLFDIDVWIDYRFNSLNYSIVLIYHAVVQFICSMVHHIYFFVFCLNAVIIVTFLFNIYSSFEQIWNVKMEWIYFYNLACFDQICYVYEYDIWYLSPKNFYFDIILHQLRRQEMFSTSSRPTAACHQLPIRIKYIVHSVIVLSISGFAHDNNMWKSTLQ